MSPAQGEDPLKAFPLDTKVHLNFHYGCIIFWFNLFLCACTATTLKQIFFMVHASNIFNWENIFKYLHRLQLTRLSRLSRPFWMITIMTAFEMIEKTHLKFSSSSQAKADFNPFMVEWKEWFLLKLYSILQYQLFTSYL